MPVGLWYVCFFGNKKSAGIFLETPALGVYGFDCVSSSRIFVLEGLLLYTKKDFRDASLEVLFLAYLLALRAFYPDSPFVLVRSTGLEPARVLPHSDLNATCLPVPPRPHDRVNMRNCKQTIVSCQMVFVILQNFSIVTRIRIISGVLQADYCNVITSPLD